MGQPPGVIECVSCKRRIENNKYGKKEIVSVGSNSLWIILKQYKHVHKYEESQSMHPKCRLRELRHYKEMDRMRKLDPNFIPTALPPEITSIPKGKRKPYTPKDKSNSAKSPADQTTDSFQTQNRANTLSMQMMTVQNEQITATNNLIDTLTNGIPALNEIKESDSLNTVHDIQEIKSYSDTQNFPIDEISDDEADEAYNTSKDITRELLHKHGKRVRTARFMENTESITQEPNRSDNFSDTEYESDSTDSFIDDASSKRQCKTQQSQMLCQDLFETNTDPAVDYQKFKRLKLVKDVALNEKLMHQKQRTFSNHLSTEQERCKYFSELQYQINSKCCDLIIEKMKKTHQNISSCFSDEEYFESCVKIILEQMVEQKNEAMHTITMKNLVIPYEIKAELIWILMDFANEYSTREKNLADLLVFYDKLTERKQDGNETGEQQACKEVSKYIKNHLDSLKSDDEIRFLRTYMLQYNNNTHAIDQNRARLVDLRSKSSSWQAILYTMYSQTNVYQSENSVLPEICQVLLLEPLLFAKIWNIFKKNVRFNCSPISDKTILEDHPCYTFKYIKEKPADKFIDAQFLYITIAEKENEMKIEINMHTNDLVEDMLKEFEHLFMNEVTAATSLMWETVRFTFLRRKFVSEIIELCKQELRRELISRAESYVIMCCARKLREVINVEPYWVKYSKDGCSKKGIRVIGISYRPENPIVASFCLLDKNGEVDRRVFTRTEKKDFTYILLEDFFKQDKFECNLVANMILETKPHVIAIAGGNYIAIKIKNAINVLLEGLKSNSTKNRIVKVEVIPNNISTIYAKGNVCKMRESEYKNRSQQFLEAQSIARFVQDPLMECSQLFNDENDILEVDLHPLQKQVPKSKLLKCLENEFVTLVNSIGLDMNNIIRFQHKMAAVQFVVGMSKKSSRMLINGFQEYSNITLDSAKETKSKPQLTNILHDSEKLSIPVIQKCLPFLRFKKQPVNDKYSAKEHRKGFVPLDGLQLFKEFTKRDVESYIGKVVHGTVTRIVWRKEKLITSSDNEITEMKCYYCKKSFGKYKTVASDHFNEQKCLYGVLGLRITLDGIEFPGFVPFSNISRQVFPNIQESLTKYTPFRIISFSQTHSNFTVSNQNIHFNWTGPLISIRLDPYFDVDKAIAPVVPTDNSTTTSRNFIPRFVTHHMFENIDTYEATHSLSLDKTNGRVIFRPSFKGYNFITASLRIQKDDIRHIEIEELEKPDKFSLGRKLRVGQSEYLDLDDFLIKHVEQMNLC